MIPSHRLYVFVLAGLNFSSKENNPSYLKCGELGSVVSTHEKKVCKAKFNYLLNNTRRSTTVLIGIVAFFGLVGCSSTPSAANSREALLQGNYVSAFRQYERAAKEGDAAAQNTLGNIYYLGLGRERDFKKAAQWYLSAAKRGEGSALVNLGILLNHGLGIEKDVMKAFACFRLAKKAGNKNAETHMKFLTRMNYITANMVEIGTRRYMDLPSLIESFKIGEP